MMARKPRIHHTETDKAVMWDRWQKGDSLEKIAQLFDRSHGSVASILRKTGGRRPPKRARSSRTLSAAWDRAHRPKTCKLTRNPVLALIVASKGP